MIIGSIDSIYQELDAMADVSTYLPAASAAVREHLRETTAAHTTSSGKKWPPKRSGAQALNNAFSAIEVRQAGNIVIVELTGHHIFHHYGAADQEVREIIPKEIDEKLGNAIRRGVVAPFQAKTKAGKRGYDATRAKGINPRTGKPI